MRDIRPVGVVVLVGSLLVGSARAADEPRGPALGTCASEKGTLLRRAAPGQPWYVVDHQEGIRAGDLIVGGGGAEIDAADGAVRLTFLGDLAELSPYPVRECAVLLRQEPGADLAFTLDRGRVDVSNRKQAGPARVRVHVRDDTWDLTLQEPGASIALELYGRWPPGVGFLKDAEPKDAAKKEVPTANLIFLTLKGDVLLKQGLQTHVLKAPPGPALIAWDSVTGQDAAPQTLDKLPAWAEPGADDSPLARQKKAVLGRFRQATLSKGLDAALDQMVGSDDPAERRLAVFILGAIDDLPRLGKVLRESRHPDVWDNGVLALRHWIGRGPGQDQVLYRALIQNRGFSPANAETVVQLLHSFDEAELSRPETYEVLIDYLDSELLPVRGLAYWHLSRLVPAGKKFGYSPVEPADRREAAVRKWKELIPPGKMPPKPQAETDR